MVIASLLILSGILFGLQNFSTDKNKESINFLPFVDTVFAKITRSFTTEFPPNSFTINFCGYGYSIMYIPEGEEYIILRGARLIKTDEYGNEIWNRTYGEDFSGSSVIQTPDGGYIIVGDNSSYGTGKDDIWLIKTDAYGNEIWNATYGGKNNDWGYSVIQSLDGGYVIVGCTWSYGAGKNDIWLIKTDAYGNEIWNATYGGKGYERGYSVIQTSDGGYIIVGYTTSYCAGHYIYNAWLIKTDEYGNEIWNRNFNKYVFRGRSDNYGFSVMQTSDGGYIIVGLSFWLYYDYDHEEYIWLIKTDAYGNETWNRIFDYEYSEHSVTWLKQLIEVANNHRPIVIITYPTNGTTVNGIVTIQGSASDEDGDETIQKVEVKIDNGKWLIATGTLNWAYTLDTTKLENGNHTIYARSYDGKEYSKIASITVEVKNQKEEIGIPGFEMIALFAAVLTVVARKRVKEK